MNRDVTECFRLLIWIEFLTKYNVIRNSTQVILHALLRYLMKTLLTFIKFHRVIQMASCDQIGDYHWLNCSWIMNEFEKYFWTTARLWISHHYQPVVESRNVLQSITLVQKVACRTCAQKIAFRFSSLRKQFSSSFTIVNVMSTKPVYWNSRVNDFKTINEYILFELVNLRIDCKVAYISRCTEAENIHLRSYSYSKIDNYQRINLGNN
jgi:hypothetical protein